MPAALILIADGTEEMEFTITYDVLVRGGVKTTSAFVPDLSSATVSVSPPAAKGSRGINIIPDSYLDFGEFGPDKYDLLVIPGGAKGAETMSKSPTVQELVRRYIQERKFVGMICAGSLVAKSAKLEKQPITSHPSVKALLENVGSRDSSYHWRPVSISSRRFPLQKNRALTSATEFDYSEEPVVVSDYLITSRGPGTTFPFALTLVELLCGKERRQEIRGPMVFPANTPF